MHVARGQGTIRVIAGKALAVVAFSSVISISWYAAAASPSFDCAKASNPIERMICGDAELAGLDRDVDAAYRAARAAAPPSDLEAMRRQQLDWLKNRNGCKSSPDMRGCIAQSYRDRIGALEKLASQSAPASSPSQERKVPTAEAAGIAGTWEGRYVCRQGPTGMQLTVTGGKTNEVSAVFRFFALPENPGIAAGEFALRGSYDPATGALDLTPDRWLKQPPGYQMVGVKGSLARDGSRLNGSIALAGCRGFELARAQAPANKPGPAPAETVRREPGSLAESKSFDEVCETLLAWVGQLPAEYPDLDLKNTVMGKIYPKASNLFRDEYFIPVFGEPYDQTTVEGRHKIHLEVARPCFGVTGKDRRYKTQFLPYQPLFDGAFLLAQGDFGFQRLSTVVTERRAISRWRDQVLSETAKLPPTLESFNTLKSDLARGSRDLAPLWPSEGREFSAALTARQSELARQIAKSTLSEIESLGNSLEDARTITARLSASGEILTALPPGEQAAFREAVARKLDAALAGSVAEDLKALAAFEPTLAGVGKSTEWYKGFESRYALFSDADPVKAGRNTFYERRNQLLQGAKPEFAASLDKLGTDAAALEKLSAALDQTLPLPGDRNLPAYADFRAAVEARKGAIQKELVQRAQQIQPCDELAAHPDDPGRLKGVKGVMDDDLNAQAAVDACLAAVEAFPDEPRFAFQLGRVLMIGGERDLASGLLSEAAAGGSAAALAYLGDLEDDPQVALELYKAAAEDGFKPAEAIADKLEEELAKAPDTEAGAPCDALAADPDDPAKPENVPGVAENALDSGAAIDACMAAVEAIPDEPRYRFELGRSLFLGAETKEEAREFLQLASDAGYAAASAYLSDLEEDQGKALALLRKAEQGGYKPATQTVNEIQTASLGQDEVSAPPVAFDKTGYHFPEIMENIFFVEEDKVPDDFESRRYIASTEMQLFFSCKDVYTEDLGDELLMYISDAARIKMHGGGDVPLDAVEMLERAKRDDGLEDGELFVSRNPCGSDGFNYFLNSVSYIISQRRDSPAGSFAQDVVGSVGGEQNVKLHKQEVQAINPARFMTPSGSAAEKQVREIAGAGQKLISCIYGPSHPDGTGFSTLEFWYKAPPPDIKAMLGGADKHPLRRLGTRALTDCPENLALAEMEARLSAAGK